MFSNGCIFCTVKLILMKHGTRFEFKERNALRQVRVWSTCFGKNAIPKKGRQGMNWRIKFSIKEKEEKDKHLQILDSVLASNKHTK